MIDTESWVPGQWGTVLRDVHGSMMRKAGRLVLQIRNLRTSCPPRLVSQDIPLAPFRVVRLPLREIQGSAPLSLPSNRIPAILVPGSCTYLRLICSARPVKTTVVHYPLFVCVCVCVCVFFVL